MTGSGSALANCVRNVLGTGVPGRKGELAVRAYGHDGVMRVSTMITRFGAHRYDVRMFDQLARLAVAGGVVLLAVGCGPAGESATPVTASPIMTASSGSTTGRVGSIEDALLAMPPEPEEGEGDVIRFGPSSGSLRQVVAELFADQQKGDACSWGTTPLGLIESVGGPMDSEAAIGIWEDHARAVVVSETIVAMADSWADKLIAKEIPAQCRDYRVPGTTPPLRQQVDKVLVRHKDDRTERLTSYRYSMEGNSGMSLNAVIHVNGHLVFLHLSGIHKTPPADSYSAIVDEAGTRAMTVLGRI
jgi:hypothetical protein